MNEPEDEPALLANGRRPKTPAELLSYLTEIGIGHATVEHPTEIVDLETFAA